MSFENIKTLKGVTVSSKRVLVRCDFNVPLNSQGDISDDFRIVQSLPTIQYLVENKAKVILMSHLDPEGTGTVLAKFNLQKVSEKLSEYLKIPIIKANDCIGPQVESQSNALQDGEVMILENLRFHKEEVEGDTEFAKKLSYIGDIYVNDAFSVCHRNHASVSLLPGYLPSYMGFLVEKEIDNLNKILYNPVKPFVVLIGGKKVESKSTIIEKISEVADCVIISGLIKKEIIEKGIKFSHPEKIIGPSDSLDSPDITEETVRVFYKEIMKAKTVLWNGPFGKFEEERYEKGTLQLADAIIESQAFSAVGGGETVEFLKKKGMIEKFSHVSTGGGAMLQYLSKESLPGLEALKN